jgi:hypothetical protein
MGTSLHSKPSSTAADSRLVCEANPLELLAQGLEVGPAQNRTAERLFVLALSEGLAQAHLGLAWLALWDNEPDFAIDHLRKFFSENQTVRADELLVKALRAVRRSGMELPNELRSQILAYCLRVSRSLQFLEQQGDAGREVRRWMLGGMPPPGLPEVSPRRNLVLLATLVTSGATLVWRYAFAGPDWLLALMPLVLVTTFYNRWMNAKSIEQRQATTKAWQNRDRTDRTSW